VLASGVSTPALHEQVQTARAALKQDQRRCRFLADLADPRSQKGDNWDPTDAAAYYGRSFREHGIDIDRLPAAEPAALIGRCPSPVPTELAAALDDWVMSVGAAGRQRPLEVARLADPDPWRNRLRSAAAQRNLPELQALAQEARDRQELSRLPAASLHGMARALFVAGDAAGAEQWLRDSLDHHVGDVWLNYALARVLRKGKWAKPRLEEAIRYYSVVRALRPEIAHDLAHALEESGDWAGAEAVFRSLTRSRPANAHHWNCLGNVLRARGDLTGAIDASSRAVELRPDSPDAWSNRGVVHHALGQFDQAIADYSAAIELKRDFAKAWYSADRTIRLWDLADGTEVRRFEGHEGTVGRVLFSPDGRSLVSGSRDKTVRLWDVATGKELRQFGEKERLASATVPIAFLPDNRTVATWPPTAGSSSGMPRRARSCPGPNGCPSESRPRLLRPTARPWLR